MQLAGATHFLVLQRCADLRNHEVWLYPKFDETLLHWEAGSRLSPLFPKCNAVAPEFVGQSWVLFFGPIHPSIDLPCPNVFLTLGIYNIVVFTSSEDERAEATRLAGQTGVRWEEWQLTDHRIDDINFSPPPTASPAISPALSSAFKLEHKELLPTLREFSSIIASTAGRASMFAPEMLSDLTRFNDAFRKSLASDRLTTVAKQGQLVIANASLSRFSSQTFAGISPVLETECHFWTHSLLGIGTASLALFRIRQFIERIVGEACISARIAAMSATAANSSSLLNLGPLDPFWDQDHLFKVTLPVPDGPPPADIPLITYFSGRDGFRSTSISLSAPLEVISSCNTTAWTLLTLTHEISHTVIEPVLAKVLPRPDIEEELEEALEILANPLLAKTLLQQLRHMICFAICRLGSDGKLKEDITPQMFAIRLHTAWPEINEILTHIFDFLYFYSSDRDKYIRAVWASWAVIPNISHRIRHYIVRTLCAVHSGNLRKDDGIELTIKETLASLEKARSEFPAAQYIPAAIDALTNSAQLYRGCLVDRLGLVRFARYFLYSPTVATLLKRDSSEDASSKSSGGKGYSLKILEFEDHKIENPLRFIEKYCDEKNGDWARSAWILQQIAFGQYP